MKYRTIVADPPWPIPAANRRAGKGGARSNATTMGYPVMDLADIMALPVADFAAPDAHLYLWVTPAFNREGVGVQVARAWGFDVVSELIWEKANLGMGLFPRSCHEPVLVCRRGGLSWDVRNVRSVQRWPQPHQGGKGKRHSAKPHAFHDLIERVSPGPYLELFARRPRLGWDVWGNEVESTIALAAD